MYDNYDNKKFFELKKSYAQNITTETPDLGYLLEEFKNGRINTDMDIQRQYVWNEEREQEMWDTLLLGVRIPEFHAILNGRIRNICDGKQRFTCIFRILEDKVPYQRKYMIKNNPYSEWLFEYNSKKNKRGENKQPSEIKFSQLPQEIQDAIMTKVITIVRYQNLTREEEISLFKKINNGMPLSDFATGLSTHYYIRKDFTDPIMNLEEFSNFNLAGEEIEKILVRSLILCSHPNINPDLRPKDLDKRYYEEYEKERIILSFQEKFIKFYKENIEYLKYINDNCQSSCSITPFFIELLYNNPDLSKMQKTYISSSVCNYHAGRGSDLSPSRVENNRKYLKDLLKECPV